MALQDEGALFQSIAITEIFSLTEISDLPHRSKWRASSDLPWLLSWLPIIALDPLVQCMPVARHGSWELHQPTNPGMNFTVMSKLVEQEKVLVMMVMLVRMILDIYIYIMIITIGFFSSTMAWPLALPCLDRLVLKVSVTANAPCDKVMAEMKARVDGQSTGLLYLCHFSHLPLASWEYCFL